MGRAICFSYFCYRTLDLIEVFMASTIGEPRRGALDGTLARVTLVSGKGALGRLGSIPTRSRHLVHPSTNVGLKIQPGTPIQPTTCPGSCIPL